MWNLFYGGLLGLQIPEGVTLIGLVDDVTITVVARNVDLIEQGVNPALQGVTGWMVEDGLMLAPEKTEAIMLTKKRAYIVLRLSAYVDTTSRYDGR